MNKKVVPDFDYLVAKGIDIKDPRALFDKLTLQMNKVSDENLKQDLLPLFTNRSYIKNWLENWRESYLRLLDDYKIHTVTRLRKIVVKAEGTDNFSFTYIYDTIEDRAVKILYTIAYEWIKFHKPLAIEVREDLGQVIFENIEPNDQLKRFVNLFFMKTTAYLQKVSHIMLGDSITTKLIRTNADNLNQKEQIVLNQSALLSCELDDLLK